MAIILERARACTPREKDAARDEEPARARGGAVPDAAERQVEHADELGTVARCHENAIRDATHVRDIEHAVVHPRHVHDMRQPRILARSQECKAGYRT